MAGLTLHFEGGQWEIIVANTDAAIALKLGAQGADEAMAVRYLANAMKGGAEQVVADAQYIFDDADQVSPEFVNELFSGANELVLEETVIFSCAENSTLLDEMEVAGEALAALF